jgi:hypothetical protein
VIAHSFLHRVLGAAMADRTVVERPVPRAFSLATALRGHGWAHLPPHTLAEGRAIGWRVAWDLPGAPPDAPLHDVETTQPGGRGRALRISVGNADRRTADGIADIVCRTLRLDLDLAPFWSLCTQDGELGWVAKQRAGYLLASPTPFEDLLKVLFTTNCSWAATRGMVERTCATANLRSQNGTRGFPPAEVCARWRTSTWKDRIRCGYRAEAARTLARLGADGRLDRIATDPDPAARRAALRELPGFGPYAVGQGLRLLGSGCYEDFALDSWCRARLGIESTADEMRWFDRLAGFGSWGGLALWMLVTAPWHEPGAGLPAL